MQVWSTAVNIIRDWPVGDWLPLVPGPTNEDHLHVRSVPLTRPDWWMYTEYKLRWSSLENSRTPSCLWNTHTIHTYIYMLISMTVIDQMRRTELAPYRTAALMGRTGPQRNKQWKELIKYSWTKAENCVNTRPTCGKSTHVSCRVHVTIRTVSVCSMTAQLTLADRCNKCFLRFYFSHISYFL